MYTPFSRIFAPKSRKTGAFIETGFRFFYTEKAQPHTKAGTVPLGILQVLICPGKANLEYLSHFPLGMRPGLSQATLIYISSEMSIWASTLQISSPAATTRRFISLPPSYLKCFCKNIKNRLPPEDIKN